MKRDPFAAPVIPGHFAPINAVEVRDGRAFFTYSDGTHETRVWPHSVRAAEALIGCKSFRRGPS